MELVPIREAARRLGVSDTALHKALKSGRITLAARDPRNDRPLLGWPQVREDFLANSDHGKRTHVGSRGAAKRANDAPTAAPRGFDPAAGQEVGGDRLHAVQGPSLAQSKAVREAYMARLAKLEYEQKAGKLVNADEVKLGWFKLVKAAQTRIMGVPAACKTRVPDLPLAAVAAIEAVCREALEDLANGAD